jgi:arginyl-tRNA synthetase
MEIAQQIKTAIKLLFAVDAEVVVTRPNPSFGDYATNAALMLAKQLGKNPREIAAQIAAELTTNQLTATVAGPGFINLRLSDAQLLNQLLQSTTLAQSWADKEVVVEYSDPNPFKVLHAGHLYTSVVGDAIANLLAAAGAVVHRVNFGGDVGLHVGKTMWAILQNLGGEEPAKLETIAKSARADWLTERYVEGNNAYDDDKGAKAQIMELNKRVYEIHATDDHTTPFAQIYWTTRQWSYDYFDEFYDRLGTHFEKYYPESETASLGLQTVREQLAQGVYAKSDGAVVFDGEQYGLHTRVFINSQGLPTYEAKDVGLIMKKWQDYHFDTSVVITANDIVEYMKVVLKSIEQFAPDLARRTVHLTHGIVKLQGGVKMSSRKGNILRAADILEAAEQANGQANDVVTLGAVKYALLKVRTGGDIIYDPKESVSLDGNSGPYLQYAFARANSVLAKSKERIAPSQTLKSIAGDERVLAVKLTEFPEVVAKAVDEFSPHLVCTYLYVLAQVFNRFYEQNRVLGDPRQEERLTLVQLYANVLKQGLALLGITAPEKM